MDDGQDTRREELRHLRRSYPRRYGELLALLTRHDPIGLIGRGGPDQEYGLEATTILPRLGEAGSVEDFQLIVHGEFVRWFSGEIAEPRSYYKGVAREAWEKIRKSPEGEQSNAGDREGR